MSVAAAATGQQTSDALVGVAHQARKRADKASEVVAGFTQRIELSQKIDASRAKLVEADSVLQTTGESMLESSNRPPPVFTSMLLRRCVCESVCVSVWVHRTCGTITHTHTFVLLNCMGSG